MRNVLLKILEKYPLLYNILLIIKYRHDDDFMQIIKGLRSNSSLVELRENPEAPEELEKKEMWCDISINGADTGFFAMVRWTLDALYFCECFGLRPYIRFSGECLYKDADMPPDRNVYNYYFEQPFSANEDSLKNAKSVVVYDSRNRRKAEMLNGDVIYQTTEEYMDQIAKIMKKYLKFNAETQAIISEQIHKRGVHEDVLGVHIRGTDYKSNYKNHPQYISPQIYYIYIDQAIQEYVFKKIYIATDDKEILQEFLSRYGSEMVLFSKDTIRSEGNQGIHTIENVERPYHKYRLGIEVICDMCSLAACGGLVSSLSQVSLMSRIYKKSKNESFRYDKRINNGINKRGKLFKANSN